MSEVETKEDLTPDRELPRLLNKQPGKPDQAVIDQWKTQYGDVYVSGFSEGELYIWRSMNRSEFVKLQMTAQEVGMNQFQLEEATCKLCVLWPDNVDEQLQKKAGTAGSLSEQIMQNSNFLTPGAASVLVAKL
jgi:hypothetical protein